MKVEKPRPGSMQEHWYKAPEPENVCCITAHGFKLQVTILAIPAHSIKTHEKILLRWISSW